jgi:hypothetical protein
LTFNYGNCVKCVNILYFKATLGYSSLKLIFQLTMAGSNCGFLH